MPIRNVNVQMNMSSILMSGREIKTFHKLTLINETKELIIRDSSGAAISRKVSKKNWR
jgi:hypothetical protein